MKIIKRDGHIVDYMPEKIENAILKANAEVEEQERVTDIQIRNIVKYIEGLKKKRMLVEDIQDIIEMRLMSLGKYALAKQYITYRYTRELVRKSNTTDMTIRELIDGESEYWNTENSNKNAKVVTVQRDYLAGITSTDITRRLLLPEDIVKAHDEGIIHFHDADYFAQSALHNCDLINLEDMLQNGTNINGVMIEKPHRFLTAMTIATQLITAVSSSQYGGCTITLTHLAPFVKESYNRYLEKYKKRKFSKEDCIKYATEDTKKEIEQKGASVEEETPILSVEMTPALAKSIREYNENNESNGGYTNESMSCYDYDDGQNKYTKVFCFSKFLDEMSEKYSDSFKFIDTDTDKRISKEERDNTKDSTQLARKITQSGYWTIYKKSTDYTLGDYNGVVGGPSWK